MKRSQPYHRLFLYTLFVLLLLPVSQGRAAETGLEPGMVNPGYHDTPAWFKQSFLDISEDIEEANRRNRRLLLYFYQDGCPYCAKLLQDNFGQRRIADKTQSYFDVIAINMWGDREVTWIDGDVSTEKVTAARLRVMFTPTLLFLDENGNVALRINGYYDPDKFEAVIEYVGRGLERKMSFQEYYAKNQPDKAAGRLHQAEFIIKQNDLQHLLEKSDKPLLVLFEQKQCKDCDELHTDVFKRPETIEQLKRFNIVRFDIRSDEEVATPHGYVTTAKEWARQLKIQYAPTMVIFENTGREIIRTEAYLKSFHIQSVMDYAASGAYKTQPSFQRFISKRADELEARGVHIELMQ
ncbi:MAG: thioredoxin fold domain-containing protein [Gammaproteobacteria bacterium]|nr:thioredoxin fold domain-containing protein [Gammaproteobacteria bacterium]MDH5652120.1 thioredoxin fold domain-containing protein [Gammaproteobacteria bacterium]